MADGVWKVVYPQVFGRSRQLSLNKFFDPSTPSMRKGRDGENGMEKKENNGENSGPLSSLPVDRLTATDCNADRSCQNFIPPYRTLSHFICVFLRLPFPYIRTFLLQFMCQYGGPEQQLTAALAYIHRQPTRIMCWGITSVQLMISFCADYMLQRL